MTRLSINNNATFHSELTVSRTSTVNHNLRLRLGLCVQKVPGVPDVFNDFSGSSFKIREWEYLEWYNFRDTIFAQCDHWNNKFWLTPPPSFSEFDVNVNGTKFRPNVKCELFVQVWNNPGDAQKNIRIARLDDSVIGDSSRFRSDAVTYDSLDGVAHTFQIPDALGNVSNIIHYTIPHEIGHALGQPHIGVLRRTAACLNAIAGNPGDPMSTGGSNSNRCYGYGEPPSIAQNIMGYGLNFEEVNAQPWRDRIAEHTSTNAANWTVSMTERPPRVAPRI